MIYAMGRIHDARDSAEVLRIVDHASARDSSVPSDALTPHGPGLRTLIHGVVRSEPFRQ